jgi:hypothetical protein
MTCAQQLGAAGYIAKLLSNAAAQSDILRNELNMLAQFELVVNTVSLEEAVQLQVGQAEIAAALN